MYMTVLAYQPCENCQVLWKVGDEPGELNPNIKLANFPQPLGNP